jgi:hypothetical protein
LEEDDCAGNEPTGCVSDGVRGQSAWQVGLANM